jgi:hypothetical protein
MMLRDPSGRLAYREGSVGRGLLLFAAESDWPTNWLIRNVAAAVLRLGIRASSC